MCHTLLCEEEAIQAVATAFNIDESQVTAKRWINGTNVAGTPWDISGDSLVFIGHVYIRTETSGTHSYWSTNYNHKTAGNKFYFSGNLAQYECTPWHNVITSYIQRIAGTGNVMISFDGWLCGYTGV